MELILIFIAIFMAIGGLLLIIYSYNDIYKHDNKLISFLLIIVGIITTILCFIPILILLYKKLTIS